MSYEFNADEILKMAEQIEKNGAGFYRKAAEVLQDPRVRTLLLDLATWEEGHEKVFSTMRANLTEHERQPRVFDPENDSILYIRSMADGHVFDIRQDPTTLLTGKETVEEILHLAIGQEKDSIVFYLGLKEFTQEKQGRERIDGVIKEEMKHIAFLNKEIAALRKAHA
jgi:rubrerythrin